MEVKALLIHIFSISILMSLLNADAWAATI